jgi:hypothetical protein
MSRPANPYDNASCESFMKTLKREEIYTNKYEDLEHLRTNIEEFIEEYYSRLRLHSALGYRSPEEFEQKTECQAELRSATMEFFENKENNKKISKGLLGTGTQMPSPFPRPLLLLGDARTLLRKRKLCPKKLCQLRGAPQYIRYNWGPNRLGQLEANADSLRFAKKDREL